MNVDSIKRILKREGVIRTLIFAAALIALLAYLILVNFHLPYMTADEIRYLVASPKAVAGTALINGRYSSLLMIPFAEVLSFSNPTHINLIPRFVSMLLLAAGIILLIRKLGFSYLGAVLFAAIVLMSHELDWQHNGLVSFFGIYNILLTMFLLALILDGEPSSSKWTSGWVFVLLIGSYASELFLGLAFCYLVLRAIINWQVKFMLRSPFFWSLASYATAFLLLKASTNIRASAAEHMSNYLVGSVGAYGVGEMLAAALLYFINALPFYHLLSIPDSISLILSSIILIAMGGYFFKLWQGLHKAEKRWGDIIAGKRAWLIAVTIFLLSVTPNFLLALQPMKVDWILRGASAHYVFSYYTWIGLAVVGVYFVKQNVLPTANIIVVKVISSIVVLALFGAALLSAKENISFARQYDGSRGKWIQLHEILKQNAGKEVVVSPVYLAHPYITAVSSEQLKELAKHYYNVRLSICTSKSEINFSEDGHEKKVLIEGFSVGEAAGRWTDGPMASLNFVDENPRINFIELEISSVFSENLSVPLIVTKGGKVYEFKLKGIGKNRFDLPDGIKGPLQIKFVIPNPASPLSLGLGSDSRNLGLMLKTVRMGFKDSTGREDLYNMESCI